MNTEENIKTLKRIAKKISDKLHCDRHGSCVHFAEIFVEEVNDQHPDLLNDFDLSANNGGWQWASGSGCDSAPQFRVFNPSEQQKKFDPNFIYIKKWIPEYGSTNYPAPIIDHAIARLRVIKLYKEALTGFGN